MPDNILYDLAAYGQSVWIDSLNRQMIESGFLKDLTAKGLRGLTSNPAIFNNAVCSADSYDKIIKELFADGKTVFEIYDDLTVRDIQDAADIFRPVYEKTNGLDGYVSLEVNPALAYKTSETIEEVKRLHKKVNRKNLMIKIPSTTEGFPAIEECLSEGININITLIFSVEQYLNTARAYLRGMESLIKKGGDAGKVCSVASVFVSRIDTAADKLIEDKINADGPLRDKLISLKGRAAAANTRIIYKKYLEIFSSGKYEKIKTFGARPQRLLFGSTGTKNPLYSDIKYVTELIGRGTINTLPEKTLLAFIKHGKVKEAINNDSREAELVIHNLKRAGVDIDKICGRLLDEGVISFKGSFDGLLQAIEGKIKNRKCG
ncbi:MAG: transaldolase [bacterium]